MNKKTCVLIRKALNNLPEHIRTRATKDMKKRWNATPRNVRHIGRAFLKQLIHDREKEAIN